MTFNLGTLLVNVREFEADASSILGTSDGSVRQRAYNAHLALENVSKLTIAQADLLKQSVRCIEAGVFRAAIVMAWAAVADLILKLCVKNSISVKALRSNWNFTDEVSLAEANGDFAIIQTLKEVGVFSKGEMKALHGMLHKRNECAHPSSYFPGANEALGFLDEAIAKATLLTSKI